LALAARARAHRLPLAVAIAAILVAVVASCALLSVTVNPIPSAGPDPVGSADSPAAGSPALIGAGDICVTGSLADAQATAALIAARPNDIVFTAGDNSNETGSATQYSDCFGKSWGAFKGRTHPVPGNHDYMTSGAGPYYSYFGAAAGPAGKGYYSYDLANNWHVVALNAICSEVGGCGAGSPQETFLRADLAANAGKHIVAIWHIPAFSSGGEHGNNETYTDWWRDLYAAHAEIVINGHDHDYERFTLQSPSGQADLNGIREFVVGTGGAGQREFGTIRANSKVRNTGALGVLELTLGARSYSWRFIPVAGTTFSDSGTQATHT
jgi:acid phosphatase type 7